MVRIMTGTPGSGKSYSMAHQIRKRLRDGKNVISTVNIALDHVTNNGKLKIGHFQYISIYDLTPELLERYALTNHAKGKESQTYVFIDECQLIFNTRDWSKQGRRDWLAFFTSHRQYGYQVFLITQHDEMVDKQIRAVVEHEIKHRKINNLLWFIPFTIFVAVETWYGNSKIKIRSEFILFRRNVSRMYDSYFLFDELARKYPDLLEADAADEEAEESNPNENQTNEPPPDELEATPAPNAEQTNPDCSPDRREGTGRVGLTGFLRKLFTAI